MVFSLCDVGPAGRVHPWDGADSEFSTSSPGTRHESSEDESGRIDRSHPPREPSGTIQPAFGAGCRRRSIRPSRCTPRSWKASWSRSRRASVAGCRRRRDEPIEVPLPAWAGLGQRARVEVLSCNTNVVATVGLGKLGRQAPMPGVVPRADRQQPGWLTRMDVVALRPYRLGLIVHGHITRSPRGTSHPRLADQPP